MAKKKPIKKKVDRKKAIAKKKRIETINRQKKNLYSNIYRKEKIFKSVKRKKDIESIKKISNELLYLKSEVDRKRRLLGLKNKFSPTKKEQVKRKKSLQRRIESQKEGQVQPIYKGYIIDPTSPLPTWEVSEQLDRDLKNKNLKWVIVEGVKYSVSLPENIQASVLSLIGRGGSQERVEIEYNPLTQTARYTRL